MALARASRVGDQIHTDPVIVGFTSGIGVIIFVGQWRTFLGCIGDLGNAFSCEADCIVRALPSLHSATTLLG